jgi:two-component system nitrate/nitrite response regulator NarL
MNEGSGERGPVSVVVADDHPVFLQGLLATLGAEASVRVVAHAEDGRSALEALREHRPDIAVLDVEMPGLSGLEVLETVTREGLPTAVVLLSGSDDPASVYEGLAAGARAFLRKGASPSAICEAVTAVANGEFVLAAELHAGIAHEIRIRSSRANSTLLSARELEVLSLAGHGLTNPQIGDRLHISAGTVKTHLHNVYEKLEVADRAAAVASALRRGLLE